MRSSTSPTWPSRFQRPAASADGRIESIGPRPTPVLTDTFGSATMTASLLESPSSCTRT